MKKISAMALAMMVAGGVQAGYLPPVCDSSDNTVGTSGEYSDEFIRTGNAGGTADCVGVVVDGDFEYKVPILLGREIYAQQDVSLTFEAWFKEAAWTNEFGWEDEVKLSNDNLGASFSASFSVGEGEGLLPFFYLAGNPAGQTRVDNGDNEAQYGDPEDPTFAFAYYEGYYYLGLNDDGGAPSGGIIDFDVDDFVVRFKVNVPEPASTALLGIGMIGLGLTRLARRKA